MICFAEDADGVPQPCAIINHLIHHGGTTSGVVKQISILLELSCTFVHHTDLTLECHRWPLRDEHSLATARHHPVAATLSFLRSYCPVSPESSRIIFNTVRCSKASSFMAPVHPPEMFLFIRGLTKNELKHVVFITAKRNPILI